MAQASTLGPLPATILPRALVATPHFPLQPGGATEFLLLPVPECFTTFPGFLTLVASLKPVNSSFIQLSSLPGVTGPGRFRAPVLYSFITSWTLIAVNWRGEGGLHSYFMEVLACKTFNSDSAKCQGLTHTFGLEHLLIPFWAKLRI